MSQKLTCLQAYQTMLRCFNNIYFQTYDDDLAFLLSGAALYSIDKEGNEEPQTMDPAVWHEWMKGIKIILNNPSAQWDTTELTLEQAYQAAGQYFSIHCDIGLLENIAKLRDLLNHNSHNIELETWLFDKWKQELVIITNSSKTDPIQHFFGDSTTLSLRESFMIMQIYLNNICMKHKNESLVTLLRNSRILNYHSNYWQEEPNLIDQTIWQLWIESIALVKENDNLNVKKMYKAIPKFLSLYFHNNQTAYIHSLIKELTTSNNFIDDNNPVVQLNAQQTEIAYHLISINTHISFDVAKKIIALWFTISHCDFDWIQYFYHAYNIILQRNRSYLIMDNEITILEAYHIMIEISKIIHQTNPSETLALFIQQNAIGSDNKPKDFMQLLAWIQCAEQISQKNI